MYNDEDEGIEIPIDFLNPFDTEARKNVDNELFSTWLDYGNEFAPAVNLKVIAAIPSGVYKMIYNNQRDEYRVTSYPINTDELFSFSESYTNKILNEVEDFWNKSEKYKKYGISHKRGILLSGKPGCGKTAAINLLIKQLIEKKGLIFIVNNLKDFNILTDSLNSVVRKIEPDRPIITIIEDIDKLIEANNGNDAEFLDFMDGKNSIDHHLIIMTSNNTSELSDALLRPSRIDMHFVLEAPSYNVRREYLERKGIDSKLLDEYAKKTDGMSFAELKEVFIATTVHDKTIDDVVQQLRNPVECKNYLNSKPNKIGL